MNRFQIKLIACLAMLIDHICRVFFPHTILSGILRFTIGRMAFPLFVFMLCQGFFYTRNRVRYCLNLLILALVSEIIYDKLFHDTYFYLREQNVVFTLLCTLILYSLLQHFTGRFFWQFLFSILIGAAAQLLRFDYGLFGVAAGIICYFTFYLQPFQSCALSCIPLIIRYGAVGSLLAAIPLYRYKKTGSRFSAPVKVAFYVFYPGHLALLLAFRILL